MFCATGQLDKVPHQSHLHLPSDQRLRGGRVFDAWHLLPRRRRSHQQLPHPELTKVRRGFRRGQHIRTHTHPYMKHSCACTQGKINLQILCQIPAELIWLQVWNCLHFLQSRWSTRQKTNCTGRIPKMHTYCIVLYFVIPRCTTPWADLSLGASFCPLT